MKIGGREINKTMLVLGTMALLFVGLASAALISYVSNSLQADVTVTGAGINIGAVEGLAADPTVVAYDFTGPIGLTGIMSGGESSITVVINNTAPPIAAADVSMLLSYNDDASPLADPLNCDPNQMYGGVLTCFNVANCGSELCLDGQEFEAVGVRTWDGAAWEGPATACVGKLPGEYDNNEYLSLDGVSCFWNFQDELAASVANGQNPLTLIQLSSQPIPTGAMYSQIAVKTTLDTTNMVQIAPGDYSLSVNIQ